MHDVVETGLGQYGGAAPLPRIHTMIQRVIESHRFQMEVCVCATEVDGPR